MESSPLSALVLAAGLGSRLRPLTDQVPKPLVPVVDRTILAHQVEAVRALGHVYPIDKIFVNAHHLADQIQAAAVAHGIDHVFVEQPEILGTGEPLQRVWEWGFHGELLVLNGDSFHDFDLVAFVQAARASHAPFALLCVDYAPANNLQINAQGLVCGRDGKYSVGEALHRKTFSGVSWYGPEALSRLRKGDFNVVDFWGREAAEGRLPLAYLAQKDATWIDMGSPAGLFRATQARLKQLNLDRWAENPSAEWILDAGATVCARASIGRGAKISQSILLPGAVVAPCEFVCNQIRGEGFQWEL